MSIATLPLLTALVAGFAHALEADHMAAVTAFVSRRPEPLRALGFGVRWALGHSVALLTVGGVVILLDLQLSAPLVRGMEFAVGAMLSALGAWALADALRPRSQDRVQRNAHSRSHSHPHAGGTTWTGAAHGLAGTAGFLALLPAAFLSSPGLAGGYLLVFGTGTVVAMGLYGLAAGALFDRVGTHAPRLGRALRVAAAIASIGIGVMWMWGTLAG